MSNTKDNAVIIFEGTDQLIEQTIAELKKSTVTDEALAALKEQYTGMVIAGIEDMKGYKAVNTAVSYLRKLRTSVEARRKELTEPALKFQREVKAEADRITAEIKPLEDSLKEQISKIDDAREAARKAEYQRRLTLLTENGYQFINGFFVCGPVQVLADNLVDMTDDQLDYHVKHGMGEIQRQKAEEQRKKDEADRLAAERAEIEKMKAELAAEKAKAEKERAELEAQKKALDKTYETVVEPEVKSMPEPTVNATIQESEPKQMVAAAFPGGGTVSFDHQQAGQTVTVQKGPALGPTETPVSKWIPKNEFERGFNAFRVQLVKLVADPNAKLTRALLTEWAWNLPPTDTKQ